MRKKNRLDELEETLEHGGLYTIEYAELLVRRHPVVAGVLVGAVLILGAT